MNDVGSIVLGWLTKLAVTIAVLGLIGFDAVAVASAHFSASSAATTAAAAAADNFQRSHDTRQAYDAAALAAGAAQDTVDQTSFTIGSNGQVALVVHRTATTLWLYRVGPLKKYARVSASGTALPSP